jgi:hypothetical protein
MHTQWSEAIGSVNGYVENLPNSTKVVLAVFDTISYDVIRNTTAKEWKNVSTEEATPRGGTPLYDSAARMMWRIMDDKPEKAIFVVMTDGEENNSRHFKQADVKSFVSQLETKKYEVIFLGANFDKVGDVAQNFGVGFDKFTNINTRNLGAYMSGTVAQASANYLNTGVAMSFTEDDKKKATA